eukprot:m.236511 g.236511  ORF g.236511 m.236511 type:complete len:523 (+) comp40134_c0_seq1:285-1853(+)
MTVSLTREQKLAFCLTQNAVRFERSLDAFAISRTLVECGVFEENPLPVGEQNKEATMALLKSLFEMWSSKNDARARQFRIFRLAVGEAGNSAECLPDLVCTEEELDAHFLQLKDVRNDVARWLTPYTAIVEELVDSSEALKLESVTSSESESILRKILSHRCCDISAVWQLLASASFLTERNRLVTLGKTLELPIIDVLDELAMKEGSATQMDTLEHVIFSLPVDKWLGVCHEMTTRSSEEFSLTEDSVVPSKGMLTRRVRLRQSADCVHFLQRILSCSKGNICQLQSLLVSRNSRQKSPEARTQRVAECFKERKGSVVDAPYCDVPNSYQHLLYKFAFQEVHVYWKQMGVSLGFDKSALDGMEKDHHRLGPKDMAWTMLHDYYQWKGRTQASIEYLRSVLRDVKWTAGSQVPFRDDINIKVIEGQLTNLHAKIHHKWELVGRKLGLPNYRIEGIASERNANAEKCIKMLRMWCYQQNGGQGTVFNLLEILFDVDVDLGDAAKDVFEESLIDNFLRWRKRSQ